MRNQNIIWVISDLLLVQLNLGPVLWTSLLHFSLTFQRHMLVSEGGDSKLPNKMNAGVQNEWRDGENAWNWDSWMFMDPTWSHIYIQRSATGTNLPSPSPTKLLLCCTIFSFQLSRQPVFSGALLQIPTPAKTHTTAHFPPAKNSPMPGDAHSGKHSERNTVYELEITTMNAALAPSLFIFLGQMCGVSRRPTLRRARELKQGFNCLRAQTVTEATLGKNTRLSWWKQEHDTTDGQHHKLDLCSLSTVGPQRDSDTYWPETTPTFYWTITSYGPFVS